MSDGRRLLDDPRARAGRRSAGALRCSPPSSLPSSAGDPYLQRDIVATRFLPPLATDSHGAFHLLGTDRFGRDVWARLLAGARVSLGVGALATIISVVLGVAVGAAAGFWRGWIGAGLLGLTDFALALPRVVLLLLLASLWQPSAALVIVVLGVTGWMPIARLVHGEVRALAVRPFVESAVGLGAPGWRVLLRHILPNALTPVTVAAASGLGNAILLEAGLSFLGLGVQPPVPSWGNLIASGRDTLVNAPWVAAAPGRGAGAGGGGGDAAGRCGARSDGAGGETGLAAGPPRGAGHLVDPPLQLGELRRGVAAAVIVLDRLDRSLSVTEVIDAGQIGGVQPAGRRARGVPVIEAEEPCRRRAPRAGCPPPPAESARCEGRRAARISSLRTARRPNGRWTGYRPGSFRSRASAPA